MEGVKPNRNEPSLPATVSANDCSLGKWHKRRLSSSATVMLPSHLKAAVEGGVVELKTQLERAPTASMAAVIQTVVDALGKLLEGTTPEYHLRAVSQITGAVMEWLSAMQAGNESEVEANSSDNMNARKKALPAELLTSEVREFILVLAKCFVFPFMLDCRVRYTHRPLVSLFRVLCESDVRLVDVFRDAFLDANLRCWSTNPSLAKCVVRQDIGGNGDSSPLRSAVSFVPGAKNEVMHLVNCLDALMMTVMPLVRSAFADTFLEILPFLGGALQWAVDNVHAHQVPRGTQSAANESGSSVVENENENAKEESGVEMGGVFGEDLECVRFCVRVVATYSHKFLDRATSVLEGNENEESGGMGADAAVNCVASLLRPAVTMLSSNLFPKDVLNAAGLLVASVLTVRRLDGLLIYRVCKMCSLRCDQECGVHHDPTCVSPGSNASSLPRMDAVVNVTKILCQPDADSTTDASKTSVELPVLASVFEQFTSNGCFAFFKGLLALFSSRIRNVPSSIGLLLQDISVNGEPVCALYSIIVPAALRYSAMVQEPNTRFMAIQTVDAVIRHISCVMDAVADTLEQAAEPSPSPAATSAANEFTKGNRLPVFCQPTKELRDTVREAVQLVMGMWDDATQQVSGPLHETYHHILHVNEAMKRCNRAFVRFCDACGSGDRIATAAAASGQTSDVATSVLDSKQALVTALKISDARRGKYHALEALQRVIPLEEFVGILDEFYGGSAAVAACAEGDESTSSSVPPESPAGIAGITGFVQMLLGASNNPKVNTTAGDVFSRFLSSVVQLEKDYRISLSPNESSATHSAASLPKKGKKMTKGEVEPQQALSTARIGASAATWLRQCIVKPLCGAILISGAIAVPANVSVPQSISNLVAHMVMPWIREHNEVMHEVLGKLVNFKETLTELGSTAPMSEQSLSVSEARASHGLVEVLYRARHVGADVNAYLVPTSVAFPLVARALQSAIGTLSSTALNLCTLSAKKTEQVAPWQCAVVETYFSLNMHQGEDSTTRKYLVETFRKWVKRLADSIARPLSGSFATKKPADDARKATKGASKKADKNNEANADDAAAAAAAEVAEQLAYVERVFLHCLRLVDVLVPHIGVSVVAANRLSSERRIAAISCYETLLRTLLPLISGSPAAGLAGVVSRAIGGSSGSSAAAPASPSSLPHITQQLSSQVEEVRRALFPESLAPVLFDTLSNSWDKMRAAAQQVLLLYCEFAPQLTAPTVEAAEEMLARAKSQLNSRTFRLSEGAVYTYILAMMGTPCGVVVTSLRAKSSVDCNVLAAWCEEHVCERANAVIRDTQTMRKRGALYICQEIQKNPLHGVASLCGSLYSIAVGLHSVADRGATHPEHAAPRKATRQTADLLLQMSCSVIQVCSLLVGGDAALSSGGPSDGEQDDTLAALVDCRGHVFRQPGAEAAANEATHRDAAEESESSMRVVVNNTWLGIRMATRVIETVVQQSTIDELALDGVRHTCFTLLDALLRTKHNGVMSTVRAALKTLSMALIRSRSKAFYDIPCELVKLLLGQHGVTSPDMARVLRRSQGLPHALVAVLEAEDPAVPAYLFPLAVKSLLRIAQGGLPDSLEEAGGSEDPRTEELIRGHRVNALNVLKFVFDDKLFSGHSIAFIQEAFSLATEGYSAGSWAIRNSSLMLFASVLHRFVGEHPSKGGTNVNTTLYDIAIRTPRGVSFAHTELQKVLARNTPAAAAAAAGGAASDAASDEHSGDQELGLFPILQMLSMLCPNPMHLISNVINGRDDDLQLVCDAVCACRSVASLMVRSASATAFAAIAPLDRISDTLQSMSGLLRTNGDARVSFDEVHGMLLQVQQFYTAYVGTLRRDIKARGPNASVTPVQTARIHAEVTELIIHTHVALCDRSLACPLIASAYFSLLADVLAFHESVAQGQQERQEGTAAALSRVVLAAAQCSNSIITHPAPQNYYAGRAEHTQAVANISLFLTVALHYAAATRITDEGSTAAAIIASVSATLAHSVVNLNQRNASLQHARAPANAALESMKHMCAYVHEGKGVLTASSVASMDSLLQRAKLSMTEVALDVVASMLSGLQMPQIAPLTARNYFELTACLQWIFMFARASTFESGCRLLPLVRSTLAKHTVSLESAEVSAHQQQQQQRAVLSTAVRSAQERLLVPYSDARSWALRCLSRCAAHNAESTALWTELLDTAARFASPEQCVEDRLAVTEVFRIVLPSLRAECHRVSAPGNTESASLVQLFVRYLLLLLRTLFDDACDVRHTACDVATEVLNNVHTSPPPQQREGVKSDVPSNARSTLTFGHSTCCVGLVRYIRAWMWNPSCESAEPPKWEADVTEYFFSEETEKAKGEEEGEERENEEEENDSSSANDDGDDEMEQLFEKESDNMYAEDAVMQLLSNILLFTTTSAEKSTAPNVDGFKVLRSIFISSSRSSASQQRATDVTQLYNYTQ